MNIINKKNNGLTNNAIKIPKIKLSRLISTCISLAHQAGNEIRKVHSQTNYKIREKGTPQKSSFDDPQTEADIRAQYIIQNSLNILYPSLKVIGEEGLTKPFEKPPCFVPPRNDIFSAKIEEEMSVKNIVVWVDPLDGTSEFIKGNVSAVTVLIGISFFGKPIAGVIAQPFSDLKNGEFLMIWGVNTAKQKIVSSNFGNVVDTRKKANLDNLLITKSHLDDEYRTYLRGLGKRELIKMGGCGSKMISLLKKEANGYVFPIQGTKKWDTCAPQAILEAAGGIFTKPNGENIEYSDENVENEEGFIATLDGEHAQFVKK
ncbi:3'(2'),5'-bisphosphate nucleotidase 1 [Bonamia ostreae]|uniref:3'(2'),5'-bisphosphate nucleotidase 1 n=1 Tax=Bonamia ostreae TaxID=126728 RepID=A0ABV2AHC9_9EUKA